MTVRALIKPLAGIGWHGLGFLKAAMRAGDRGVGNNFTHLVAPVGVPLSVEG